VQRGMQHSCNACQSTPPQPAQPGSSRVWYGCGHPATGDRRSMSKLNTGRPGTALSPLQAAQAAQAASAAALDCWKHKHVAALQRRRTM
jgi:hypothetical protein